MMNQNLTVQTKNTTQSAQDPLEHHIYDENDKHTAHHPPLLDVLCLIAKSNWGMVWKVHDRDNNEFRALKRIERDLDPPEATAIDYRRVPDTEVQFLKRFTLEGVVFAPKLYSSWEIKRKNGKLVHYQKMELFDTDLFTYAKKWLILWNGTFTKPFRLAFELGMRGILHGDLQWNQFLIKFSTTDKELIERVVVSDFGFTSDVLDKCSSWFLEGWTVAFWKLGYFHYIQDVNDILKRKLFAIFINVQQIVAAILYFKMNVFYELDEKTKTRHLYIVKSFSFGKYQVVMESLIAPMQLKAIQTTYDCLLKASLDYLTARHKNDTPIFTKFDFSRMFSGDVISFLDAETKLLFTTQILNKMVIDSNCG